jgi:hypothetical protein
MKILFDRWIAADKKNPCPVCTGKAKSDGNGHYSNPSVCMIAISGEVALCRHFIGESDKHGNPIRYGTSNVPPLYLHRLKNTKPIPIRHVTPTSPKVDIQAAWDLICTGPPMFPAGSIRRFADSLSVTDKSLAALGVRQTTPSTWAFPMWSVDFMGGRKVVGIRLRKENAEQKWAVTGSVNGLFVAGDALDHDSLAICEGATDAAVMFDVGVPVIGRASALTCYDECCNVAGGKDVFICGDNDPDGRTGATELANRIGRFARSVKLGYPPRPHKDLRAWRIAGATNEAIKEWIRCTKNFQK